MNTVRKIRLFFAWQDEQEEEWLREMARQGLHLQRVTIPCFYYFVEGDPADVVYRLDYKTSTQKDKDVYVQLFEDAGWEYLGGLGNGWEYFRKENRPGEEMEIYTDVESKIEKYQRLIMYLVIFMPILGISVINLGEYGWHGFQFFMFLMIMLYTFILMKLIQRINTLKKLL